MVQLGVTVSADKRYVICCVKVCRRITKDRSIPLELPLPVVL